MASTRKASREARGAARSSKAAAAGSTKKAGATKASKKAAKKGGSGGTVTHPPVIVTDGSAAIGLVTNVFRRDPPGATTRVGRRLKLLDVEVKRNGGGGETCITLNPNESAVITVTTSIGGAAPKNFTITGVNSNDPSSSLVLDFDHGAFPQGPIVAGRRLFRNPNRTIDSLTIVTSTGRTHNCQFVGSGQPGFIVEFHDDHV